MFRSIRARLTLLYTLIVAVTFIVVAVVTYKFIGSKLNDALDRSLMSEAIWILNTLDKHRESSDKPEQVVDAILDHSAFYPTKEYVEIWNRDGTLFLRTNNLGENSLMPYVSVTEETKWALETINSFRDLQIRLLMQASHHGTLLIAMPTESVSSTLGELVTVMAWMFPIVILLAIVGGFFLSKRALAKVNQVTEAAKQLSADRLHDRIPPHGVDDEIGRLIATFNGMIGRLNYSFVQMKQFSADASHELRTPLTVIRTQLENALISRIPPSEMKKTVAKCLDEAIRMSTILENLLLLGRGDAGQLMLKKERVRLDELLTETHEESVILASQKSIGVELEVRDNVLIWGDRDRLRQMILNLVDNAIKYSQEKTTITLALSRNNGSANVVIRDQGIGIPREEIGRIFDRFYRVDRARSRSLGGSGLGLSIVRFIVDAHNGTIDVKSRLNQGSEFIVSLPVATM